MKVRELITLLEKVSPDEDIFILNQATGGIDPLEIHDVYASVLGPYYYIS